MIDPVRKAYWDTRELAGEDVQPFIDERNQVAETMRQKEWDDYHLIGHRFTVDCASVMENYVNVHSKNV